METSIQNGDQDVLNLIICTGKRVREIRKNKGISRQKLSMLSGVSPRYLAQLETGSGNISIGLLQRIAGALETRIEWLIGKDDPNCSDVMRVAEKFRSASVQVQGQVLDALGLEPHDTTRAKRICLIGLRGAGKSTLGGNVAKELDIPFIELNREIEKNSGMPVAEVMALYGQEGYRDLEAQALARIIQAQDKMILAVSGGIISTPETYNLLLRSFHTIWIKTSPEEHMSRVRAQGDVRPMAGNPKAMRQLKAILSSRKTLYEKAQLQLDTSQKTKETSQKELVELIDAHHFLTA
ncbi:MAG: helix-turn-helix transcriptional regulator [Amylibacter sp.]|nr:helix-turn-helix transcriptional regulator [Amylibacter sp.]